MFGARQPVCRMTIFEAPSVFGREKAVQETEDVQCLLTEKGRNIYVELLKSLPSIL
jgi:hypothetical protein